MSFFFPQPKPTPRIFGKREDQRSAEKQWRAVCAQVDARDQKRCRCCARRGDPNSTTALNRIHRHHIRYRSKGGDDSARNILTVCALCHSLIHGQQLFILGADANQRVQFEIHEAAVVEVFANRQLPAHVRIVAPSRRLLRLTR